MIRKSFSVLPGTTKVLDAEQGIVEAWVNTTAVKDLQNDIMEPGCWSEIIKAADVGEVDRPSTVWGHDWDVTTGLVLSSAEYAPGDPLIPEKIAKAGGGALKITTQYNLDTQRGREAFSDVKKGVIKQWSVGFIPDPASVSWDKGVRRIGKVFEWPEVSNVLVGASPGTFSASTKAVGGSEEDRKARTADRLQRARSLVKWCRAWVWMIGPDDPDSKSKLDTEDAREAAKYKLRDSEGKVKFPINDCADVEDAWGLRGSSSIPKDKVERHVRSAASKLNCDGPWNEEGGKGADPADQKDLPTLEGDEAQHNGPLQQALDGIKTLIQQECAEDGYNEFDDICRLCFCAQDLLRWAKGEATEYGSSPYGIFDLMDAGREALDAKAAKEPPTLSDEALVAFVHQMNPAEAERQSTQHNVPDDSDDDSFATLWPTSRPAFGSLAGPPPRKPARR